jgi:hypothetical protein
LRRIVAGFPFVSLLLCPIAAWIFARACAGTQVSRTSNQPSSAQTSVLNIERRLSFALRTIRSREGIALCTSYCVCRPYVEHVHFRSLQQARPPELLPRISSPPAPHTWRRNVQTPTLTAGDQCISSSKWPTLQATGGFAPPAKSRSRSATRPAPRWAPRTMCAASCIAASPRITFPP